jgi:hypothetical protein
MAATLPGSQPKLVYKKKPAGAKFTRESRFQCDKYCGESLLPDLFVTRKFFFKMLVPNTSRSRLPVYSLLGSGDSLCIPYRGIETPWCIHHQRVVLITGESFY